MFALVAVACAPAPPPPPPPPVLPNAPLGAPAGAAVVSFPTGGQRAIDFPDPFVLHVPNPPPPPFPGAPPATPGFYAYSTGSGFTIVQVLKSTDLTTWTWVGDAFAGPDPSAWAELFGFTWAPSVIERPTNPASRRFVMYYTARSHAPGSAGLQCIGRATSPRPEGPFVDERTTPLICDTTRGGSVDPNPVVVGANVYLLWQSHGNASAGEPRGCGAPC